jgi:hypothetical protein
VTIVGDTACFAGLAPRAIGPELLARIAHHFESSSTPNQHFAFVYRLEAYLDLSGQQLEWSEKGSRSWRRKWRGFAGALASKRFGAGTRPTYFHLVGRLLRSWGDDKTISFDLPSSPRTAPAPPLAHAIAAFDELQPSAAKTRYWKGWSTRNKRGKKVNFRFYNLSQRLGDKFSSTFFEACGRFIRTRSIDTLPCANEFSEYVASYSANLDANTFCDPEQLGNFLNQFMLWFFRSKEAAGNQIGNISHAWRTFVLFLEEQLLGKQWAMPFRAIPRPDVAPTISGASTNIRTTKDGRAIKYKLITEVPLSVSDAEAVNLLWRDIERDVDLLVRWAREEVERAWQRHLARKSLAASGVACTIGPIGGSRNGNSERVTRENPDYLSHAAATFERRGVEKFVHGESPAPAQLYPRPLSKTAWELGLPCPVVLTAFATLLVREHPAITPAFLSSLRIFDKNGERVGFYTLDGVSYLRGFKNRKGPHLAEQKIPLSAATAELVERLIEITTPQRTFLRRRRKASWRYLFLSMASMGIAPSAYAFTDHSLCRDEIATGLLGAGARDLNEAKDLSSRFTLQRLRASAGVLVYFETQSVERMASALGHTYHEPKLLDRYLPKVLQEFFVERWIRLFQMGMICEAMKAEEPSLLLEATDCRSIEELNTILEKHLFRRPPPHLVDPQISGPRVASTAPREDCVIFNISTETLTVLISLQWAVASSDSTVCGHAKRWYSIAERLVPYLETEEQFRPLVARAKAKASPDTYRRLL